jgi:hypothetical protein
VLKGLVTAGAVLGVAAIFPESLVFPFFGVVLGLFSGILPGMAMSMPDRARPLVEWVAVVVTLGLGMAGFWVSPIYLVAAWVLHGIWGGLHAVTALGDPFPRSYPGFCLSFDTVMAGFVVYLWLLGT